MQIRSGSRGTGNTCRHNCRVYINIYYLVFTKRTQRAVGKDNFTREPLSPFISTESRVRKRTIAPNLMAIWNAIAMSLGGLLALITAQPHARGYNEPPVCLYNHTRDHFNGGQFPEDFSLMPDCTRKAKITTIGNKIFRRKSTLSKTVFSKTL